MSAFGHTVGYVRRMTYDEEARIMAVTGPDFISLQVRDLERSAAFYERYLGLKRSDAGPPHAVVFGTRPIAFAVRDVVAGTDLDAVAQPGQGMALWQIGRASCRERG